MQYSWIRWGTDLVLVVMVRRRDTAQRRFVRHWGIITYNSSICIFQVIFKVFKLIHKIRREHCLIRGIVGSHWGCDWLQSEGCVHSNSCNATANGKWWLHRVEWWVVARTDATGVTLTGIHHVVFRIFQWWFDNYILSWLLYFLSRPHCYQGDVIKRRQFFFSFRNLLDKSEESR